MSHFSITHCAIGQVFQKGDVDHFWILLEDSQLRSFVALHTAILSSPTLTNTHGMECEAALEHPDRNQKKIADYSNYHLPKASHQPSSPPHSGTQPGHEPRVARVKPCYHRLQTMGFLGSFFMRKIVGNEG